MEINSNEKKEDEGKNNPAPEEINNSQNSELNMLRLALEQLTGLIKTWIQAKYSHDNTGLIIFSLLVTLILITMIILALNEVLHENSIGTIMGSLIGYALGKFANSSSNDKK